MFADVNEVMRAYHVKSGCTCRRAIKVRLTEVLIDENGEKVSKTSRFNTTVGRVFCMTIVPDGLPFDAG